MRDLAHAIEDVLGVLRDGHQQLNGDVADLLFSAVDVLKLQLASEGRSDDEVAVARLIQTLGELAVSLSQPPPRPAPPVVVPRTIGTGPRALLVEDSPTVRMLEEMLLTDAGFEVDSVGDGLEALTRALAGVYDLVVSGIEIPGMGGLDLARALRAAPSAQHLPIIIMTSSERAADRQRAAELGVDELIRKGSLGRQRLVEAAQSVAQRRTM
jgi:CheY-like chemotaxis protein